MDDTKCLLSEIELATTLNLSYWTVRQLRLQQGLPHIKCGRRIFYRLVTVNDWLAQQEQNETPTTNSHIRAIN